jgi:hypothetical protein
MLRWWHCLGLFLVTACGRELGDGSGQLYPDAGASVREDGGAPMTDGACLEGLFTLATGPGPWALAVDNERVYWTTCLVDDAGTALVGSVMSVPKCGGIPTTLAARQFAPGLVALDSTRIFWTTGTGVVSESKSGGTPTTLASKQGFPQGIAIDANNIYWADQESGQECLPDTGTIMKAPLGGGTATTLASHLFGPAYVTVHDGVLYWSNAGSGTVLSVSVDGGVVSTIASGKNASAADELAVDDTGIYWENPLLLDATLMKAGLDGGALTALVTMPLARGEFSGLALSDTEVYWTQTEVNLNGARRGEGLVARVSKSGGTPTTLASRLGSPSAVVVDNASVYWTDGPAIFKLTPR